MFDKLKDPDHLVETKAEFIELVESFMEGETENVKGDCIAVYFALPGLNEPEIIINPMRNVQKKLDYYAAAYNDELQLHNNTAVKIVGISFL